MKSGFWHGRREPMEELARSLRHNNEIIAMDVTLDSAMDQFARFLPISNPKITVLVNWCRCRESMVKFMQQSDAEVIGYGAAQYRWR